MPIPVPTEAEESRVLMKYMKLKGYQFTHIKNETGRSFGGSRVKNYRAMWDARDGVSKGFPDFAIVADKQLLFIELKRIKGSSTSPEQKAWIAALAGSGVPSSICKGAGEAIEFIERTLKLRTS